MAAAQISRYEQGSNAPRPQVIAKLAAALDLPFDLLMSGLEAQDAEERAPGMRAIRVLLPVELLTRLEAAATAERRSIGQEVRMRLQATFDDTVVTTVEARVKPGAEEKRFEFNADEIADKVVERLEGRERKAARKVILRSGNVESIVPISQDAMEQLYQRMLRVLDGPSVDVPPRGNEPYGPQRSSNAKKRLPKQPKE